MEKRRKDLTPEIRRQVVQEYLAGAKTIVIQYKYKISPGEMYRTLHEAGVSLRRNHLQPLALLEMPFAMRVRELAIRCDDMDVDEAIEKLDDILLECLKGDPVGTVSLIVGLNNPFTVEQIMKAAFEYLIRDVLRRIPDAEYLGDDRWRIKPDEGKG